MPAFTPPPLNSYEGPAQGFTPPPVSSHEGPAQPSGWQTFLSEIDPRNSVPAMAKGLWNSLTPADVEERQAVQQNTPEDRAKYAAQVQARRDVQARGGNTQFIGPPKPEEDVPTVGQVAGHVGATAVNAGLLALATHKIVPPVARVVGSGLRRLAVPVADSALGVSAIQRGYGKTPGLAALEETKGIRPATVAASARDRIGLLNNEIEDRLAGSSYEPSLQPARDVVAGRITAAEAGNSSEAPAELNPMLGQLTTPGRGFAGATEFPQGSSTPFRVVPPTTPSGAVDPFGLPTVERGAAPSPVISERQSPLDFLRMKREFGKDHTKWNPLAPRGEVGTGRQAYHALDLELDKADPDVASLNQRISSLIPVAEDADKKALNAGVTQNVMHRVAAHTGAMALGAGAGYAAGGIPGMIAGTVIPELVSTPAARMAAARALYGTGKLLGNTAAQRTAQAALLSGGVLGINNQKKGGLLY